MWIVCQCEILLAQQKAHWDPQHPHDFQAHLAVVEPFLLYASCLQTLEDEINHLHTGAEGIDRQGVHFVQGEIARLRKMAKWPILLPALDQLL